MDCVINIDIVKYVVCVSGGVLLLRVVIVELINEALDDPKHDLDS